MDKRVRLIVPEHYTHLRMRSVWEQRTMEDMIAEMIRADIKKVKGDYEKYARRNSRSK